MINISEEPAEIISAHTTGGTTVIVLFGDGTVRVVDLEPLLNGPIFDELAADGEFQKLYVDPELRTIVWPNGADLDPDVVRSLPSVANPLARIIYQAAAFSWKRFERSKASREREYQRALERRSKRIVAAHKAAIRDASSRQALSQQRRVVANVPLQTIKVTKASEVNASAQRKRTRTTVQIEVKNTRAG